MSLRIVLLACCLFILGAWQTAPIETGETRTITLNGETPTLITFEASAGDVVTLTLTSEDDDPLADPVLAVRNPQNRQIAYNDNHFTLNPDLRSTDAVIEALWLKMDGEYTIFVDTYGGIYAGDVVLTLESDDVFDIRIDSTDDATIITGMIPAGTPYHYTFSAAADDTITVTLRDTSGTLDPILTLMDADGEIIAQNDDHAGDDLTLNAFDSQLRNTILPNAGEYTLIVRDFLGMSGAFEMTIVRMP